MRRHDIDPHFYLTQLLVNRVRPGNTVVDGSWQPEIGYIAILPE